VPGDYLAVSNVDRGGAGGNPVQVVRLVGGWKSENLGSTFGFDDGPSTVWTNVSNVVEYMAADGSPKVFAVAHSGTVPQLYEFNFDTETWSFLANLGEGQVIQNGSGFVHVTGSDGQPYLVILYRTSGSLGLFTRYNGTSVTQHFSGFGLIGQAFWSIAYKGVVYFKDQSTSGSNDSLFYAFDPVTLAISFSSYAPFFQRSLGADALFTIGKRLFYVTSDQATNNAQVIEFVAGSWVGLGALAGLTKWRPSSSQARRAWFPISDTKTLLIGPGLSTGAASAVWDGVIATLAEIVAGTITFTDVTDPVIPSFLRGPSSVGAGAIFGVYGCQQVIDNELTPGTPQFFMYFNPSVYSTNNNQWSLWQITDETAEMQLVETTEVNGDFSMPYSRPSGSQWSHYPTGLRIMIRDNAQGTGGALITYRCNGDPLVVNHGAVAGGPFEAGETMTSSSGGSATIDLVPSGTQVQLVAVTGTFLAGDTLTQTTGAAAGANATQNGASTGYLSDKTVRFRFVDTFGVPIGLCTLLSGSATGGTSAVSGANDVINVLADRTIVYTVVWDFLSDGVPNASRLNVQAEIVRP
jgi:hypothetical protein